MTMYDDNRVVTLLREIDPPLGPPDRLQDVRRKARHSESRRASALAGLMAVVLAAGVVSVVNLGGRGKTETLSVAGAANATAAARSATITMEWVVTKSANPSLPLGPVMTLKGPGKFDGTEFQLSGTFMKQPFELRGIGKDRWMKGSFSGSLGGVTLKPWTHSVETGESSGDVLGDMNSADPTKLLDILKSKGETLSQKRDGDRTKTVLRVPAGLFAGAGSAAGSQPTEVTVLSDEDNRIRVMTTETTAPEFGTTRTTIRYDDFGIEFDVQPPPADQVQEQEDVSNSLRKSFEGTGSPSGDTKKACENFRSFVKARPQPTNEQERQQQAQFDETFAKICPKG